MANPRSVLPRHIIRQLRPSQLCFYSSSTSSSAPLTLAYDHHAPPERPTSSTRSPSSPTTSPILFLHGLFGSRKNNRTVSRVLARDLGRHVYTLDLRNHGDSPHAPEHTYNAMASDVAHFISSHSLVNPTLIGHSMGAKTAMTLALTSPDLVADIVSVDNAPLDAALGSSFGKYVRAMRRIEEAGTTKQREADAILAEVEPELPIRQFLLGNLTRDKGKTTQKFKVPMGVLGRALDNLGDFPFRDPEKVRFEKPALFVRGTHSKYVPDEAIPLIGRFFPKFRMVDIEAGHWVISEKPDQFLKAVIEFLEPKE